MRCDYCRFSFSKCILIIAIPSTTPTPVPVEKSSSFSECGMTWTNGNRYNRGVSSRIVGGRQAIPHNHPWQVLLYNRGQFCGGQIIILRFTKNFSQLS